MTGIDLAAPGMTVAQAMVTAPKLFDEHASARELRRFFADDHVHAALLVDGAGVLLAVVERADLTGSKDDVPAVGLGRLAGRIAHHDAALDEVGEAMRAGGRRRLAVVDGAGRLVGLLCMKRGFNGFCSDSDVRARAQDEGCRPA